LLSRWSVVAVCVIAVGGCGVVAATTKAERTLNFELCGKNANTKNGKKIETRKIDELTFLDGFTR